MSEMIGQVIPVNIEEEMKKSYIDYSMSVIVGRALPDVRDGLKPIHRRILYAMNNLGLTPDKAFRKSATIVGEVMGKYHPHGDSAIYYAMVRMAQDFSMRHMLVQGHGNFGSIDGDSAAAMRYTEARMSRLALEMLADINKETVDFVPNFDESLKEPSVLPSKFPNLMVNGSSGIAVGMATNIPPHNLQEVIDGVIKLIDDPQATIEDLMEIVQGPDFPTGGLILGKEGIRNMYMEGKGSVIMRAKALIEPMDAQRERILITEIPYMVNKSRLLERIADQVRDKRIEGISDLRDESDRTGLRIVIELKRDANANIILNQLYKHTQMQNTFGANMLALVDNKPRVLNLKEILNHYLEHQKDIITRRTKYDMAQAQDRVHVLEGLRIALANLDEVIAIIRQAQDDVSAKEELISTFDLTDRQAQVILDMRLRRLTALEQEKIENEYKELKKKIEYYQKVLASEEIVLSIIRDELIAIRDKFGEKRRTKIIQDDGDIDIEDLIEEEDVVITLTSVGYIKRQPTTTYRSQRRGGRGVTSVTTREEDFVERIYVTTTHHVLMFFTNQGNVFTLKAYEIPEAGRTARGMAIVNLLPLNPGERVNNVIPIKDFEDDKYILFSTREGVVKRTLLSQYKNTRKTGLIAISLREGDQLIGVRLVKNEEHVILGTKHGMAIRFCVDDVRATGRTAIGVKGISLDGDDEVVSMDIIIEDKDILVVTERGFGKRTHESEFRPQGRGGKGVILQRITDKTGPVTGIRVVEEADDVMFCTSSGILIRTSVAGISKMSRNTLGVTLMKLGEEDKLTSLALVDED